MRKNEIDWKSFAKSLLWRIIVEHKNEYSGYDMMMVDGPEGRNIKKGDIGCFSIQSYLDPFSYKRLTWKQLALEVGLFAEYLTNDGHDCKVCPNREKCQAYFKDNPDQERCRWWMEHFKENNEDKK